MQKIEKDAQGFIEKTYEEKEGKLEGECVLFYPSGEVKGRSFYKDGRLHGPSLFFAENGNLLSSTYFQEGKAEGECKRFYLDGSLYAHLRYQTGVLEGEQKYFYENQVLKTLLFYHKGLLQGKVLLFFPSSQKKRECHYNAGVKFGKEVIYSEEGVVLDEGEFLEGLPVGVHKRRFANGMLKEEKRYHTPKKVERSQWNEQGNLLYQGIYLDEERFQETRYGVSKEIQEIREGIWDGNRIRWTEKGD